MFRLCHHLKEPYFLLIHPPTTQPHQPTHPPTLDLTYSVHRRASDRQTRGFTCSLTCTIATSLPINRFILTEFTPAGIRILTRWLKSLHQRFPPEWRSLTPLLQHFNIHSDLTTKREVWYGIRDEENLPSDWLTDSAICSLVRLVVQASSPTFKKGQCLILRSLLRFP